MFARRRLAGRLIPVNTHFITARGLQASSRSRFPAKDSQDKDSLKPEPNEYSKSASDDKAAAATEEAAFSPNMTRPEEEHDHAGKEASGQDVSVFLCLTAWPVFGVPSDGMEVVSLTMQANMSCENR